MNKLRIGMVGGGIGAFIGPIHRMAARLDDRYTLCAGVFSPEAQENRDSAAELGVDPARCYDSYQQMFDAESTRADGIDVVVIVTPNHLHFAAARAALLAGFAVICEKPMTVSLAQAHELQAVAQDSRQPFLLTHTYSGYPLVQHARHLVADGMLGQIRAFAVEYLQEWLTEAPPADNRQAAWRLDPELAGAAGCLGDIGTHAFQLASYITGEKLRRISANLTSTLPERRVDDNVQALLELSGGVSGTLWASQTAPGHENNLTIRVVGSLASLEWSQENPNQLWFCPLGQPRQRITRRAELLSPFAASNTRTPGGHPEGYLEAFANLYSQFANILELPVDRQAATAHDLLPGISTGCQGLAFIEAALRSSRLDGQWVQLEQHSEQGGQHE